MDNIKEKYISESEKLFIQIFGEDLLNEMNNSGNSENVVFNSFSDGDETTLCQTLFNVVFGYGENQVMAYEFPDVERVYNLMVKKDYSKLDKEEKKVEKNPFTDYMDLSKENIVKLFGKEISKKLKKVKMKPIKWEGLNITTCHITATSPCIRKRFTPDWIRYFAERDYTMLDLFLQSVFHYGYQYGIDTVIKPMQDEINIASRKLSEAMKKIDK